MPTETEIKKFILEEAAMLIVAATEIGTLKVEKILAHTEKNDYTGFQEAQALLADMATFYSDVAIRLGQIDVLFPRADDKWFHGHYAAQKADRKSAFFNLCL